jgi:hypothetical protein
MVVNGLTHEVQLLPGEKFQGTIQLLNNSSITESCRIYQTDYFFKNTGESWYEKTGTIQRSNGSWIKVSSRLVTLNYNVTTAVNFEVTIPSDSTLKGTYWSVIMIEGITPPDTAKTRNGLTINSVIRYAVQIITHIGDTGTRELKFINVNLIKNNPVTGLDIDMENPGERALRPKVSVELFDGNGLTQGIFTTDPMRIFPGCSIRVRIPIEALKPGKYKGVLVAECEDDYIFGSNIEVEI